MPFAMPLPLRAARELMAFSQATLAAVAHVGESTILRIEQAQTQPHPSTRRKIAHALNLEPWQIRWPLPQPRNGA